MSTVQEIVSAAKQLAPDQFLQLRKELEQLEEELWQAEREQATADLSRQGITDEDIDRFVLRRRREGRP